MPLTISSDDRSVEWDFPSSSRQIYLTGADVGHPIASMRPRSRPSSTKGVLKIIATKKPESVKAQRKIEIKKAS
jgi:hypothetical protein